MTDEQRITLAHQLYEMRRTIQRLWPDDWREKLAPHIEDVKNIAAEYGIDVIQVLPMMAREVKSKGERLPDNLILWLSAATVEAIEPTEGSE